MTSEVGSPPNLGRNLLIVTILLIAFALRCAGLDYQELRGDEAFGYFFSLPGFGEIVHQTLSLHEPHPVASYWVQHVWLLLAGHDEFALRFPGVWWGVLAVALMTPLAARLSLSKATGVVAGVLMALSPYAIWHAQDARMYSMSLALTMTSTVLAIVWWRAENRTKQVRIALAYIAMTWLALHTHYFAVYIVMAQNIAILGWAIFARTWRKLALWWGIGVLVLLAWLPWVLAAWSILVDYRGNGDSPGIVEAIIRAQSAFGAGVAVPIELRPWWTIVTIVTIGLGSIALWRIPNKLGCGALWFLFIYWLIPLAATWLGAQNRPIFNERYLVAIVPPVYLLMASAVDGLQVSANWPLWLGRGAPAVVAVGMAFGIVKQANDPQYSKTRGWRELATTLQAMTSSADPLHVRLVQNYPDPTLWYYYQGEVPHLVLPPNANNAEQTGNEVNRLAKEGVDTIFLVEQPSDSWDAAAIAQTALGKEYELAATETVKQWPISLWLRPPATLEARQIDYAGGLHLTGALVKPIEASAGGTVAVFLQWQDDPGALDTSEAVSLQMFDSNGALVAQSDRPLSIASNATTEAASYAILLPTTLAAGDYQLFVIVYDPSQEGAPRRLTVDGFDKQLLAAVKITAAGQE